MTVNALVYINKIICTSQFHTTEWKILMLQRTDIMLQKSSWSALEGPMTNQVGVGS